MGVRLLAAKAQSVSPLGVVALFCHCCFCDVRCWVEADGLENKCMTGALTIAVGLTSLRLWVCALQGISHTNKIKNTFKIKFLTS